MGDSFLMRDRFRGFLPVVVDVETGGFNSSTDALLEIAAVLLSLDGSGRLVRGATIREHVRPFMAIACFRLFTFLPDLPLASVPFFFLRMARFTELPAFLPYFAMVVSFHVLIPGPTSKSAHLSLPRSKASWISSASSLVRPSRRRNSFTSSAATSMASPASRPRAICVSFSFSKRSRSS
jgi:DNA polymerase III epsilon subunit-like protein